LTLRSPKVIVLLLALYLRVENRLHPRHHGAHGVVGPPVSAVHGRAFMNFLRCGVEIGAVARYDKFHQHNFLAHARMGGTDVDKFAVRFRAPDRVSVVPLVG
jgi:hypothetical protein